MDDRPQPPAHQAQHSIWKRAGTVIASLAPPGVTAILSAVLAEITAGIEAGSRPEPAAALPGQDQPRRPHLRAQLKRALGRVDVWTLIATIIIAAGTIILVVIALMPGS